MFQVGADLPLSAGRVTPHTKWVAGRFSTTTTMPKRSFYARDNAAKTDVPMTDHANVPCKLLPAPSTASGGTLPPVEEIEFEMEGGARQELMLAD